MVSLGEPSSLGVDGLTGGLQGLRLGGTGPGATEEAGSAQLRAMSHQGSRISSLTGHTDIRGTDRGCGPGRQTVLLAAASTRSSRLDDLDVGSGLS